MQQYSFYFTSTGYLDLLSETKVQRGILLFVGTMDQELLVEIKTLMGENNKNSFFYTAHTEDSPSVQIYTKDLKHSMTWNQVKTLSFFVTVQCI